jgi:uncharacterized protein (UPF0548 family)
MAAHALSRERTEALRAASLTYEGVGATAQTAPPGYEALRRSRLIARRDFGSTVEDLMTWRVHEQAGLEVTASSPRVEEGTVLILRLGVGALALRAPCRVVYVVDEPRRRGFAYGTLPGHPESGEELFVVHQRDDGQLAFTISAFSKHASAPAKIGGPITRWVQQRMTTRYLRALDRLGQWRTD